MPRTLAYSVLDVFAERPLAGNPLAVFHDARSLTTDEMQALARETNLAETTFVLPHEDPAHEKEHGVRVRIFTTQEELPFAGHPTLGTASWLYFSHPTLRGASEITLQLNVGPIKVAFDAPDANKPGIRGTMQQNDPTFGTVHSRATVAGLLSLDEQDLLEGYSPQTVSTGLPFCIVPLRDVEAARRLAVRQREAQLWLANTDAKFFYCVAPTSEENLWHARMQFYSGEDPATGSACGCCISYLVHNGLAKSGIQQRIQQGIEIMRPSLLFASAKKDSPRVHSVFVAGRTIPVATGSYFLP